MLLAVKDFFGPGIGAGSNRTYIVTRGLENGASSAARHRVTIDRRRFTRSSSIFLLAWQWMCA